MKEVQFAVTGSGGGGGRDWGLAGGGGSESGTPATTRGAGPGRTGGGGGRPPCPAPACSARCWLMAATWFFRPSPLCTTAPHHAELNRSLCRLVQPLLQFTSVYRSHNEDAKQGAPVTKTGRV